MSTDYIITDHNYKDFINPVINGEMKQHGCMSRDYRANPLGSFKFAEPFPDSLLLDGKEIDERIKEMVAAKADLLSLREKEYDTLKSLDQNGYPLCWAFSSTKANMYLRVMQNQKPARLSAWYVAGKVTGWKARGGWGSESLEQICTGGVPEEKDCPEFSRRYDTVEVESAAKLNVCTEWWEGSDDPEKAFHQLASACASLRLPGITDWGWWSHSTCTAWVVSYLDPESVTDNSWGESAGLKGLYHLKGSKTFPNGLWIPRVQLAS